MNGGIKMANFKIGSLSLKYDTTKYDLIFLIMKNIISF